MVISLPVQGRQFLLAIVLGLCNGFHFGLLRGLWRVFPRLRHVLDVWFCLVLLAGNLCFALYLGDGEFRLFMLFGVFLGLGIYFFTLSRRLTPLFIGFWQIITGPVRFLCRGGKKILEFLKKSAKKLFPSEKKSVTIKGRTPVHRRKLHERERMDAPAQIVTHYETCPSGHRDL